MEGQENKEKPILPPPLSFCHLSAGRRTVSQPVAAIWRKARAKLMSLLLFRGHSFNVNPPGHFISNQSKRVKVSQTGAMGQLGRQIVCKSMNMNTLQNNRLAGESNPIKVNQTDLMCLKHMGNPAFLLVRQSLVGGGCVSSVRGRSRQKPKACQSGLFVKSFTQQF
jgi:hypothetical protein